MVPLDNQRTPAHAHAGVDTSRASDHQLKMDGDFLWIGYRWTDDSRQDPLWDLLVRSVKHLAEVSHDHSPCCETCRDRAKAIAGEPLARAILKGKPQPEGFGPYGES